MSETARELLSALDRQRIINTHCHHLDDSFQNKLNLESLLRNAYVSWCGVDFDKTIEKRRAYFQRVRFNSYFHWLEIGLQHLYDLSVPLNESTWELFDERIKAAGRDPNHHLEILEDRCHHEQVLLDAYWAPGSDDVGTRNCSSRSTASISFCSDIHRKRKIITGTIRSKMNTGRQQST